MRRRRHVSIGTDQQAVPSIINRDRDGFYADAARQGAPQARQVADRFHLLKNLRATIARQLGGLEAPIRTSATEIEDDQDASQQPTVDRADRHSETVERERLRRHRRAARLAMFDKIRALYDAGSTVREIAQKLGLGPRRVYRWVRRIDMPEHSAMAPKPFSPVYFRAFLARSWAEGTTKVRHLFSDTRHRVSIRAGFHHATRSREEVGVVDLSRLRHAPKRPQSTR